MRNRLCDTLDRTGAIDILDRVAARLATPDAWCRLDRAQDSDGHLVNAWSSRAVRWDISAALWLAGDGCDIQDQRAASIALCAAVGLSYEYNIDLWQDIPGRTHAEALALLATARDLLSHGAVPVHPAQPVQHSATAEP